MINPNGTTPSTEYDQILRKLEELMRKHQRRSPGASQRRVEADPASRSTDSIPTLTEIVDFSPSLLAPQPDITALLEHVLDSALKDAGVDLGEDARVALVRSLQTHLFGL